MKKILIIVLIAGASLGAYFGYQYYYVQTLQLSELVGKTDDSLTNIAVNFFDFDTGLTRNDIRRLKNNKDYWLDRMKEIENIHDPDLKMEANTKLLSDMMDDPTLKKVLKGTMSKSSEFILGIFNML